MLEWIYLTNRVRYSEIFENQEIRENDFCHNSLIKQENRIFGKLATEALDLNENEISRLYEEDLYQLILHEVGHTLGLNHNFAASTLQQLRPLQQQSAFTQSGLGPMGIR